MVDDLPGRAGRPRGVGRVARGLSAARRCVVAGEPAAARAALHSDPGISARRPQPLPLVRAPGQLSRAVRGGEGPVPALSAARSVRRGTAGLAQLRRARGAGRRLLRPRALSARLSARSRRGPRRTPEASCTCRTSPTSSTTPGAPPLRPRAGTDRALHDRRAGRDAARRPAESGGRDRRRDLRLRPHHEAAARGRRRGGVASGRLLVVARRRDGRRAARPRRSRRLVGGGADRLFRAGLVPGLMSNLRNVLLHVGSLDDAQASAVSSVVLLATLSVPALLAAATRRRLGLEIALAWTAISYALFAPHLSSTEDLILLVVMLTVWRAEEIPPRLRLPYPALCIVPQFLGGSAAIVLGSGVEGAAAGALPPLAFAAKLAPGAVVAAHLRPAAHSVSGRSSSS